MRHTAAQVPYVPRGTLRADRRAKKAHDLGVTVFKRNHLTALILRCTQDRRANNRVWYPPGAGPYALVLESLL